MFQSRFLLYFDCVHIIGGLMAKNRRRVNGARQKLTHWSAAPTVSSLSTLRCQIRDAPCWVTLSIHAFCSHVQTWRHPSEIHNIATPPEEDRATVHDHKNGEDWMCSSGNMLADNHTQTDRHTDELIAVFCSPVPERSIIIEGTASRCNAWYGHNSTKESLCIGLYRDVLCANG